MLLRDGQEQARVLYAAKRDSPDSPQDVYFVHLEEISQVIDVF